MAKIALLVGVSEYLPEFDNLPSTLKDVEAMKEVLGNSEMGGFDDIKVLKNSNRQEIEEAIYELFANQNKDDLLLFYFSGHGAKDEDGDLFLATCESSKHQHVIKDYTAVAASYLKTRMNKSYSKRLVVILDCCFSGAFTEGMIAKGDENIVDIKAELGGKGRAILMSSSAVQSSFQSTGSELSIYTKYLVEGIKTGAADTDKNGQISADELHEYASKKVQQESQQMTPKFFTYMEEGDQIYLVSSPHSEIKVEILPPPKVIELPSERNVDYTKLRNLLKNHQWKKADKETARCMSKICDLTLTIDIVAFPSTDLRTINQLWVEHSNGKFGFSVQKEIYHKLGGTEKYDKGVWKRFGDEVGWRQRKFLFKEWLSYDNLTFDLSTIYKGHLPALEGKFLRLLNL